MRAGYRAIQLDPNNALAYLNTSNCEAFLGHDDRAIALQERSVQLAANGGGGLSAVGVETGSTLNRGWHFYLTGDPAAAALVFSQPVKQVYRGIASAMPSFRANSFIALHDISASRRVPDATRIIAAFNEKLRVWRRTKEYRELAQRWGW